MLSKYLLLALIPVLIFSQLVPTPAISSRVQSSDWDLIGQAGGPSQGIAVQGDYAFMGVGSRLVVVDISDPVNPHLIGATTPFDYLVQGVTVSGVFAYVAAGSAGLRIVNIATPSNPSEVGAWDSPGFAENVAVSGSTAYLADGPYGLRVVDVSNPTMPAQIAHAFDTNYAVDVAINGRYAYIAADGAGLLVAEISNPHYPIEAGAYDTIGYARSVAVAGNRVVLADEHNGLVILNISDPIHPIMSGSVQLEGWAFDVTVSGNLAYVAAAFGGLQIVNISNPAVPVVSGSITWSRSNTVSVAAANGHILIADRKNGLRVMDISDPASPSEIGYWNIFSMAYAVDIHNNYAYVAAGFNGIRIYSLSDPSHPVEMGSFLADGFFYMVKVSEDRLFAGTMTGSSQGGLYAWDISDPADPILIGYDNRVGECRGIDVVGNMVYVADGDGLKVFDISNPPSFTMPGFYPLNQTRGLTVSNGLAFVTQQLEGLQILDVSNPADIHLAGSFKAANSFTFGPVGLSGQYAYITEAWGLRVLDISNLVAPEEVSFTPTRGESNWLVLNESGDRAYVADGSYGFSEYDVSNPAAPQLINQIAVMGSVLVLDLAGEQIAAGSNEGGLQIFTVTASGRSPQVLIPSQFQPGAPQAPIFLPHPRPEIQIALPTNNPPAIDRPAGTCTVTSTANTGSGTLRNCLENQVSGDVITFSPTVFPTSAPATIHVGPERLPFLTQDWITIDASNAGVILDGSAVTGAWDTGIGIFSNNNIVRGLQVLNFPLGIGVMGDNNVIGGSRLVGDGPTGQGNVVSGNWQDGILLQLGAEGNIVLGNIVGLDATGTQAFPNQWCGISINKAAHNTIGSLSPGEDNIVSANQGDGGIQLYGFTTVGNKIIGNKVGTDISGTQDLGNRTVGVYIESGSLNTLLQGNLISGNDWSEVSVWDDETDFSILIGNFIGTNLAGDAAFPNLVSTGIGLGYASYTRIGGTAPGEGNVVANHSGISIEAPFGGNNRIVGNHIGVNAAGTGTLVSEGGVEGRAGVFLGGATRTLVGGTTSPETNLITANGFFSVKLMSMNNVIAGNGMGLAVDGVTPLGSVGFQVLSLRDGNIIQGNRIANSTSAGIWMDGAQGDTIRRNLIWANPFQGIFLENGANANLAAPTLSLNASGGSGTTCPDCVVELFLDEGNQGRFYLNSVTADSAGVFNFPAYCPLPYPNLTATATDLQGNTSQFSDPQTVAWDCSSARTIPILVSIDPTNQPALAPTFLLTLSGEYFYADSVVRWDGMALPTTIISDTLAQAVVPAYLFQEGGEFPVTIYTPAPGGGESGALIVSVTPPEKIYLPVVLR